MSLERKERRSRPFRSNRRLCRFVRSLQLGVRRGDSLVELGRLEKDVALFFERESLRRGHQKETVEREGTDCSREPWKCRTECVVHFQTLFRVAPIQFLL